MKSKVKSILEYCEDYNIEIVSYGLAPNPTGFCYEYDHESNDVESLGVFNGMLDNLTRVEERELRNIIFNRSES